MKRLTITAKVALLCTLVTAAVSALALAALLYGEQRMLGEYYRDTLASASQLAQDDITWTEHGIDIDRDLDDMPEVKPAVYTLEGDLLYGREEFTAEFAEGVRRLDANGGRWYVCDRRVDSGDGKSVWLRLYMPSGAAGSLSGAWRRLVMAIFPGLVILAGLGGYCVARRAVRPVAQMTDMADSIAGGEDLKKRIELTGARDELHRLAGVLNDMLGRLEGAFEREKRFTADVSHELRTPVTAILAQSDFALSETADDPDRIEALTEINRRARGMRDITQKLLLLSRMEAGQVRPEFEQTDVALIAEMAAETFAEDIAQRGAALHLELPEKAEVRGDQTMLTQAAMNLVENALRHSQPGGNVWISVEASADKVLLAVRDDGPGMTGEQAARVFERFYQADPARRGEGVGLGLSLTERIVQLHSGHIGLETAPGAGCRFTITLPKGETSE